MFETRPSKRQKEQDPGYFVGCNHPRLLSLIGNANGLALLAHGHARRSLLCADCPSLGIVLDEGDSLATRYHSDFLESFETAEDGGKPVLGCVVGQIT